MENFYNPLVSIIIPVYNGEKYIKNAIDSALNQRYSNIEIIVVNDGSTDNTSIICEKYKNKIKLLNKENGGVSSALNLGIANMKGEYFSWLSHDDEYNRNKIYNQIKLINKLEDLDSIVFSNWSIFSFSKYFNWKIKINNILKKKYINNKWLILYFSLFSGCTLLIPKKYLEIDNFNEKLRVTQDYDMWLNFCKKYNFIFDKSISTKVRIHNNQGSLNLNNIDKEELSCLWINILNSFKNNNIFLENKFFFYIYLCNKFKNETIEKYIKENIDMNRKNNLIFKKEQKIFFKLKYLFLSYIIFFFVRKLYYIINGLLIKLKITK